MYASLLHLAKCKTQFEALQALTDTGDLPAAVLKCLELGSLLAGAPGPLAEATVTTDTSAKRSLSGLDCLESCERNLVFVLNLSMQKA